MDYDPNHDVKLLVQCLNRIAVLQPDGSSLFVRRFFCSLFVRVSEGEGKQGAS